MLISLYRGVSKISFCCKGGGKKFIGGLILSFLCMGEVGAGNLAIFCIGSQILAIFCIGVGGQVLVIFCIRGSNFGHFV